MMRRLAHLVLLLVGMAFCYGLQMSKPHYADLIGPIPVRGMVGDTVVGRSFEVRAEKLEFARKLKTDRFGETNVLTTGGVWAVVTVAFAATDRSTSVAVASWRGPTGLTYDHTERLSFVNSGFLPVTVDPGLPRKARLVFEVSPEEAGNATVLISSKLLAALDSQAEISLGPVVASADGMPAGTVDTLDLSQPIDGQPK